MNREKAIIVDIDGTLADIEHRVPFVQSKPPEWKKFMEGIPDDELHHWCRDLIIAMKSTGHKIILITGRGEHYDTLSKKWLSDNNISYDEFYSRKSKDRRPDEVVKKEIYLDHIKDNFEIIFVLDDRLSVVKMWRDDLKLPTLQPDWGVF